MTSTRSRVLGALSVAGVLLVSQVATADVNYPNFSDASKLKLNGSAATSGDVLRLVDGSNDQAGSAFTKRPVVDTTKSFSTNFRLSMHDSNFVGDGMAFVIHSNEARALGDLGGGLGYGGIDNSVAVEFDVFDNGGGEPSDNHIAIVKNGKAAKDANATDPPFVMFGDPFKVWVDYAAAEKRLSVYASQANAKPEEPVVTAKVGLAGLTDENARAGFTAGTGGATIQGDVLRWKLTQ